MNTVFSKLISLPKYFLHVVGAENSEGIRIYSFIRFVILQVGFRLFPPRSLLFLNHEISFDIKRTGPTTTYYYGVNEPHDMLFLVSYLGRENTFVDVGANIGLFTLVANICNCKRIFSFEPDESNYSLLTENLDKWHVKNVDSVRKAVGRAKSTASLAGSDVGAHLTDSEVEAGQQRVEVDRLDSMIAEDINEKCVLKIDVEGHELDVLRGAAQLLERGVVDVILVELNSNSIKFGVSHDEVKEYLRQYDFHACEFNLRTGTLLPINSNLPSSGGNTIFVRNECMPLQLDTLSFEYKQALAQRKFVFRHLVYS